MFYYTVEADQPGGTFTHVSPGCFQVLANNNNTYIAVELVLMERADREKQIYVP